MTNSGLALAVTWVVVVLAGCSGGGGGHGGGGGGMALPFLMVSGTSSPNPWLSGSAGTLTITLTNTDALGATAQPTTITASLAALTGVSYSSASGAGWDCSRSSGVQLNCTYAPAVGPNSSAPALVVTFALALNASGATGLALMGTNASALPTTFMGGANIAITTRYSVGGTTTGLAGAGLVLEDNGGDDLPVAASGPFMFGTPLANNAPYDVTVKTQPMGQSCQIGNGSGTVPGANVTNVTLTCVTPTGHFAFVGDFALQSVSVYLLGGSGALTQITGSPFSAADVHAVVITPSGAWLYAADYTPGTITGFSVGSGTGTLTELAGFPRTVGLQPDALAIDPGGKFLYVGNLGDSTVSAFTIDPSSGALTAVPGSPFTVPGARWVSVEPLGRFLYVTGSAVAGYAIDATTGALTAVAGSPFAAGTNPTVIAFDPAGKFAYVTDNGSLGISAFTIAANGALTSITGSPFPVAAGPYGVAIDPTGTYLYVSSTTANTISGYTIASTTGALTALFAGVATGTGPTQIAIDSSDSFLYVTNEGSANVSAYAIGGGGGLSPLASSPIAAGVGASSIVVH